MTAPYLGLPMFFFTQEGRDDSSSSSNRVPDAWDLLTFAEVTLPVIVKRLRHSVLQQRKSKSNANANANVDSNSNSNSNANANANANSDSNANVNANANDDELTKADVMAECIAKCLAPAPLERVSCAALLKAGAAVGPVEGEAAKRCVGFSFVHF